MSGLKLGIVGYVPPLSFDNGMADGFLKNLERFPCRYEKLLFTDANPGPDSRYKDMIHLKLNVDDFARPIKEEMVSRGQNPQYVANNAVFLSGLRIAAEQGFTHILYVEADCRFGEVGWDATVFEEYFDYAVPLVCAGSLVCWNIQAAGMEGMELWQELIANNNSRRNFPIPTYGWGQDKGSDRIALFPNGALGVYDMEWMKRLIDLNDTQNFARLHAWDFVLGERIWDTFKLRTFEVVANLKTVYSSYGDTITKEEERLQMLRDKKVCAIHQCKSKAQP